MDESAPEMYKWSISKGHASQNYKKAGTLVSELPDTFVEEKFARILNPTSLKAFEEVSEMWPYTPVAMVAKIISALAIVIPGFRIWEPHFSISHLIYLVITTEIWTK